MKLTSFTFQICLLKKWYSLTAKHSNMWSKLKTIICVQLSRKPTAIRHIAVQQTSISQHHGYPIEGPTETHCTWQHYCIEKFYGWPLIYPSLCQEMPVSRTANVRFSSLDLPEIFSGICGAIKIFQRTTCIGINLQKEFLYQLM